MLVHRVGEDPQGSVSALVSTLQQLFGVAGARVSSELSPDTLWCARVAATGSLVIGDLWCARVAAMADVLELEAALSTAPAPQRPSGATEPAPAGALPAHS